MNPFYAQKLGVDVVELSGMPFYILLPPDEALRFREAITQLNKSPELPVTIALSQAVQGGATLLVQWELQLISSESGLPDIIQCIAYHQSASTNTSLLSLPASSFEQERYNAYELSAEGLWRLELPVPIPISWPVEKQVNHCREHGVIAECNDNMAKMYGLSRCEEMIGMRLDALMNLDDPTELQLLTSFINNGYKLTNTETKEKDVNGRKLYFLNNMTGIIENGMLLRIWGTQQDITVRKAAEEEMQRNELFYRNLISDSLDGILLTDEKGVISFASPSVEKVLGFRPADLIKTNAFEYVHPDDKALAASAFEDELNMEPVTKFIDVRLKTNYGEWIYCNVRGHNLMYNPYVRRMAIYFHDESRRKEAEDKLKQSEQRFRQLINNLQVGIVLFNEKLQVILCNQAACNLMGMSEQQMLNSNAFYPKYKFIKEDGSTLTKDQLPSQVAFKTGKIVKDVVLGLDIPDKKERTWLLVTSEPLADANGRNRTVISSFTEITEQKKNYWKKMSDEISKQKSFSQLMIDAQEKERSELAKELKQNISQQLAEAHSYLKNAEANADKEMHESIHHAKKLLNNIINNIKKMSESLIPSALGDIGLVDSIEEICNSIERTRTMAVDFSHDQFSQNQLPANMKLMLFRIFQELLNNVLLHSGANMIRVKLENSAKEIRLKISDNGKGFDLLNTEEGAGLSNARNRASLFGGKINIRSTPKMGCEAEVVIPLK